MKYINDFKTFEGFFSKLRNERKNDKLLKQVDNQLKQHLKEFLNKKYSFQYAIYIWKKENENYEEIDVNDFLFTDIMVQPRHDWDSGKVSDVFFYLYFIDKDGDEIAVHFEKDTPTQNLIDLEYKNIAQRGKNVLNGTITDYANPDNYPHKNGMIDLVPVDYKSVKLLEEVKTIFEVLNDQIKNQ